MNQIEDRLEILELTARYAYYVDTFQTEKIMMLWADDAVFDESRVGTGLHKGAAEIRAFFEGLTKIITHQAHITSNHLIEEINDTVAKAIVFSLVEAVTIAGNMRAVVYYADDYVKQNGRWVFRSRVIHPLMPFDTEAMAKANEKV
jgi:ketosteroid isomerase-like protein